MKKHSCHRFLTLPTPANYRSLDKNHLPHRREGRALTNRWPRIATQHRANRRRSEKASRPAANTAVPQLIRPASLLCGCTYLVNAQLNAALLGMETCRLREILGKSPYPFLEFGLLHSLSRNCILLGGRFAHGMCATHKAQVGEDLLAFIKTMIR